MSVKTMGQVWELNIPSTKKFILLAMADHADHNGGNIYPSLGLVAKKTGCSERHVKRVVAEYRKDKVLIVTAKPAGKPIKYRVDIEAAKKLYGLIDTHDTMSPPDDIGGDSRVMGGVTDDVKRGDTESPKPSIEPSVNQEDSAPVSADASVASVEEPKPTPASDVKTDTDQDIAKRPWFDYPRMEKAVQVAFKVRGSYERNILNMLRGTAAKKKGKDTEWSALNFKVPAEPEEVELFGQWWQKHYPGVTPPSTPEKIENKFLLFRAERAKYEASLKIQQINTAEQMRQEYQNIVIPSAEEIEAVKRLIAEQYGDKEMT